MPTYAQLQVYGTQEQVGSDYTTDVASGDFSGAIGTWSNDDAAVPNAPKALVTLVIPDFGAPPSLGETFELWGIRQNTVGTSDDTGAPSGVDANSAEFIESFPVEDVDALQRITRPISLEGVVDITFYIRNLTTQNMNNDGATPFRLWITPYADGIVV